MFFKKKKNKQEVVFDSKQTVGKNASDVLVLISKMEEFPEAEEKAKVVHDNLKYLSPSTDADVHKIDQEIHRKIDDLKIEVNKMNKDRQIEQTLSVLNTLQSLIVQRNEESKRFKVKK